MKKQKSLCVLAGAVTLAAVAGCSATTSAQVEHPPGGSSSASRSTPSPTARPTSSDPYVAAIDEFHRLGVQVWADSDLVSRWQDGPKEFHKALVRDAELAKLPGVVGVKVADELGYNDGLDSPKQVQHFLDDTATGLRALAPDTKILVDMVVPDLGCLPWESSQLPQATQCALEERGAHPATTMAAVDGYLASGDVDQLDLSTGLRDASEYASWGISVDEAQRAAWGEVHRRGWQNEVTLQSRHALADPGGYDGSAAAAWGEVNTYVRIPSQEGAQAVQVWAWRQEYDGQVVQLMNPGLQPNPLWQALLAARRSGMVMTTTFSPSSVQKSVPADAQAIAKVFKGVYVAAGTG